MLKRLNKKKKGFTLIELVIVLAVLAIIALIAIPNFTKVRNDSLEKADVQTAEQIKDITLMAVADKDVALGRVYHIDFASGTMAIAGVATTDDYHIMMKEVSEAQVNGKSDYLVDIDTEGNVSVGYTSNGTSFDGETLTK